MNEGKTLFAQPMAGTLLHCPASAAMTISSDERQFFVTMGERIASMREARNLTQSLLAEALGVTQQTVQAYGPGSRRIPVSALPTVARTLSTVKRDADFARVSSWPHLLC